MPKFQNNIFSGYTRDHDTHIDKCVYWPIFCDQMYLVFHAMGRRQTQRLF